jgi:Ca2+/Na+ antiporter
MGETLGKLFVNIETLPAGGFGDVQVLFLGGTYAYILFQASNMISDGSELLLLVPSLAGIVGSVVLPVLGAVPDGAIVIFSGLGPNAQSQLTVGVGALAGSTIMLLTLPWVLAIVAGRVHVDKDSGECIYKRPAGTPRRGWRKLSTNPEESWSLFGTAVQYGPEVNFNAKLMFITAFLYLVIQIPASRLKGEKGAQITLGEHLWSLVGLILCTAMFFGYLIYQTMSSGAEMEELADQKIADRTARAIENDQLTLTGAMVAVLLECKTNPKTKAR